MTKFQKTVKEVFDSPIGVYPNKMVCKKDGTVEVKKSFFYTHGQTAEKWAENVKRAILATGFSVEVEGYQDWNAWPKTSYFVAVVGR